MLYQGLVESNFRFCCSVLETCGITTCCTLEKLHNRAIRIITDRPLRLPSIAEMICQESASMVYKAINGQVPAYLSSLFNNISAVTNRMLHNSNLNLRPPRKRIKCGQNSFAYRGAPIWNSLPNNCRTAHTFPTFKVKIKAILA